MKIMIVAPNHRIDLRICPYFISALIQANHSSTMEFHPGR